LLVENYSNSRRVNPVGFLAIFIRALAQSTSAENKQSSVRKKFSRKLTFFFASFLVHMSRRTIFHAEANLRLLGKRGC
jgi:hypothetical protein